MAHGSSVKAATGRSTSCCRGERLIHGRDPIDGCQRSRILSSQAGIWTPDRLIFSNFPTGTSWIACEIFVTGWAQARGGKAQQAESVDMVGGSSEIDYWCD